MFFSLDAPIKDYAWGSPGAISRFRGSGSSNKPEAEQWFGNHPESRTVIGLETGPSDFSSWLGETETRLPLLVKLLAADQPLSIQAHPGAWQAEEGFAAEKTRGVPDELRTYRDASAKPELLIALSAQFQALVGFVEEAEIRRRLAVWQHAGLDALTYDVLSTKLAGPIDEAVSWALENGPEVRQCLSALQQWVPTVNVARGNVVDDRPELELVKELWAFHPHDAGVLLSLLMHHVVLKRGEAVFVDAGIVHAYLQGFGLEVMLPSDNVVRAGLTVKKRDTTEFLAIADLTRQSLPPVVKAESSDDGQRYEGFPASFSVTQVTEDGQLPLGQQPAIVLVESGSGALSGELSARAVSSGDVLFVTADEGKLLTTGLDSVWVVHPTAHLN